jgi:hypothetical protein
VSRTLLTGARESQRVFDVQEVFPSEIQLNPLKLMVFEPSQVDSELGAFLVAVINFLGARLRNSLL